MSRRTVKLSRLVTRPKRTIRPKRIDTGLYHGKTIIFGNRNTFSEKKSRRTWKPNVHHVRLYSEILDKRLRIKVTTSALRCIDKAGGLDNYLLKTKEKKIDSAFGFWLKDKISQSKTKNLEKAQFEKNAEKVAQQLADYFEANPELYENALHEEMKLQEKSLERHMARLNLSSANEHILIEDPDAQLYDVKEKILDKEEAEEEAMWRRFTKVENRLARPKYSKKDPYYTLETWLKPEQIESVHEHSKKDFERITKIREKLARLNKPDIDW